MTVISLTSVPPRFERLAPILDKLVAQGADRVLLVLPKHYRRFGRLGATPRVPNGVEVILVDHDLGPATKVLPAVRMLRGTGQTLVYCDDDCLYDPGWLTALLAAKGDVAVGACFSIARLGRAGGNLTGNDIAQGFAGVRINPDDMPDTAFDIPKPAWAVDDIWLSGVYASQGLEIANVPAARARVVPLEGPGLQDDQVDGVSRAEANRAAAEAVHNRFGVWRSI